MSNSIVGVSDHGGWAVLVTVGDDSSVLDRRRIELIDDDLPALPHHHEGQTMAVGDAIALVERVRASAMKHARERLKELSADVSSIKRIALRRCPPLPPTVAERLTDYRARNNADWVMYREALASAALDRGWSVCWFDTKNIDVQAESALRIPDFDLYFASLRKAMGAPWNTDHKIAFAGAVACRVTPSNRPTSD